MNWLRDAWKSNRRPPASRVAALLSAEGIPSPDAGRFRTDNGIRHPVSGKWHQSTIVNIGRSPLFAAIVRYGLRSMGDQVRFTPEGPRELTDADFRDDLTSKPKVIRNSESLHITAPAQFDPVVDPTSHDALVKVLDQRAGTQRGKPRSRNPAANPLGCRVFDMSCGWPMYRVAQSKSFRYTCGLYQQSHSQSCNHNHVDGPMAARFALSCIRQKLASPTVSSKLKQRLQELAQAEPSARGPGKQIGDVQMELAGIRSQLTTAARNFALAVNDAQRKAVCAVIDEMTRKAESLERKIASHHPPLRVDSDHVAEVNKAIHLVDRLVDLADAPEDFLTARHLFDITNLRLFFRFEERKLKKRSVNKVAGGVVTFGAGEPPVPLYEGPT